MLMIKRVILAFALATSLLLGRPSSETYHGHATCVVAEKSTIRVLILKHSHERMADDDANLAVKAIEAAKAKGLSIELIGNYNITKNGKKVSDIQEEQEEQYELKELKTFVSSQMQINSLRDDTFFIFTIGHGMPSGDLHNIGQRADLMKAFAQAAQDNRQRTIWWQLSCHACAELPLIDSLTPEQQRLFNMVASSPASETSGAGIEGDIMKRVFLALAENSEKINPNRDNTITFEELKMFLNSEEPKRGDLLFSQNTTSPIFLNKIYRFKIIDKSGDNKTFGENYIPIP